MAIEAVDEPTGLLEAALFAHTVDVDDGRVPAFATRRQARVKLPALPRRRALAMSCRLLRSSTRCLDY